MADKLTSNTPLDVLKGQEALSIGDNYEVVYEESDSESAGSYEVDWEYFMEAGEMIGPAPGEEITRASAEMQTQLDDTFEAWTVSSDEAVDFDIADDEALARKMESNLDALLNLQETHPSTEEHPTLIMQRPDLENYTPPEDGGEEEGTGTEAIEEQQTISILQTGETNSQSEQQESTRYQKLKGLAGKIAKETTPVAIGIGASMATKGAAAAWVGGPALAGIAGGIGTGVRVGVTLGMENIDNLSPEDLDKSEVSNIHERYVMKQKRRQEKGGKINALVRAMKMPEQWAVERVYKAEDREKSIDSKLSLMGIDIKVGEDGQAYYETPDGKELAALLSEADFENESTEENYLDELIKDMAVQGRLARFSTSTNESVRSLKKDIFLQACAVKGESSEAALEANLEAAKAEFSTKEKVATTGMLAGISTAKSAFKGAIGVALAESVVGDRIEDLLEDGLEYAHDKFEYVSETLKEKTEQLAETIKGFRENGSRLVAALMAREDARKGLEQVVRYSNEIHAIKGIEGTLHGAAEATTNTLTETVEGIEIPEFETMDVEIPSGSTIGEELTETLSSNGAELNIWGTDSAEVWGAMIFENQETDFFQDAMAIAESVGDEQWVEFANELGFDPETGMFDKEAVLSLVEKAKSGDRDAFQKIYRMFHWVRGGDSIKIPTDIQTILENGLVQEVTQEAPINEVSSIVGEAAEDILDSADSALEQEIISETITNIDERAAELTESIKEFSGSEDPIADLVNKIEELGDQIGQIEGVLEPQAEAIEQLTDEIEQAYDEMGGLEALSNEYFKMYDMILAEYPEYQDAFDFFGPQDMERYQATFEGVKDNLSSPEDLAKWGLIGTGGYLMFLHGPLSRAKRKRRIRSQQRAEDALRAEREAARNQDTPQETEEEPIINVGQSYSATTSTLGPDVEIEFTQDGQPTGNEKGPEDLPVPPLVEDATEDEIVEKQPEDLAVPPLEEEAPEKQPEDLPVPPINEEDKNLEQEEQLREEQQKLADQVIQAAYIERERNLKEYREQGLIPFYREKIEFETVEVEGMKPRKIPIPKVEMIGNSRDTNMEDLRLEIRRERQQEIIDEAAREDVELTQSELQARLNSPENSKLINSRLERVVSPDINMTREEKAKYPKELENRNLLLNYIRINFK